jgi:hypothetical protein
VVVFGHFVWSSSSSSSIGFWGIGRAGGFCGSCGNGGGGPGITVLPTGRVLAGGLSCVGIGNGLRGETVSGLGGAPVGFGGGVVGLVSISSSASSCDFGGAVVLRTRSVFDFDALIRGSVCLRDTEFCGTGLDGSGSAEPRCSSDTLFESLANSFTGGGSWFTSIYSHG